MRKLRALDLFCCAGGASAGLVAAGYDDPRSTRRSMRHREPCLGRLLHATHRRRSLPHLLHLGTSRVRAAADANTRSAMGAIR
jgi:hypothetical protein